VSWLLEPTLATYLRVSLTSWLPADLQITQNHTALLLQASSTTVLSQSLLSVQHGLSSLSLSLTRLSSKITTPHRYLQSHVRHLSDLQRASDLLRRAGRFLGVARRLEIQMLEMEDEGTGEAAPGTAGDRRVSIAQLGRRESELGGAAAITPFGEEGRRERGMNRAALSIAELGQCCSLALRPRPTSQADKK
jgi:hypothetical protein